ncbi:Fc receptor-like protein 5, partial [Lates japonicus]
MGQTLFFLLEFILLNTLSYCGHAQDAVLSLEPNWSTFFTGESVTFICGMKEGKDTDWEYRINRDDREFVSYNTHKGYTLYLQSSGYSGKYQCSGRHKSSRAIKNSNIVSLTISDKPRTTLTPGPTTIPVGDNVTLTCSVEGSAGWKYEWYRRSGFSHTLLVRDGVINKVISVSQGGTYWCIGGRGNPVFYTYPSDEVSIEITFSNVRVSVTLQHSWPQIFSRETITVRYLHPAASLTVNPDREQHFTSDSVSLSCEGNSTEWRVMGFTESGYLSDCSYWGKMTGSICSISSLQYTDSRVYWCEFGSGEFSNAVNITVRR